MYSRDVADGANLASDASRSLALKPPAYLGMRGTTPRVAACQLVVRLEVAEGAAGGRGFSSPENAGRGP
jgi:hypothetical protein